MVPPCTVVNCLVMPSKPKLVKITWVDHCGVNVSWSTLKELKAIKVPMFVTVGYIVDDRDDAVVVASTIPASSGGWQYGSGFLIVRGAITDIQNL